MTAKTWKRGLALTLVLLTAQAPSAFAGHLLDSALEAAAEVGARRAPAAGVASVRPGAVRAAAAQAPAGQGDRGGTGSRKVWALIGAGVALGLIMMRIDRAVEDSTPSTRRERRDGCGFLCS